MNYLRTLELTDELSLNMQPVEKPRKKVILDKYFVT
jgi:hypothetical protein